MSALYLLDIDISLCNDPANVVKKAQKALRGVPAENEGNGELVWLFKVLGESRIIAVTKNTPEPFWEALSSAAGSEVTVKCDPLRSYENFAQSINKVDPELCEPSPRKLEPGENERIYLADAIMSYKGFTQKELLTTWPKESAYMLEARKKGEMQIELFKVVGGNRVVTFLVADHDALDDLSFNIPIVVELGDNTILLIRELKAL